MPKGQIILYIPFSLFSKQNAFKKGLKFQTTSCRHLVLFSPGEQWGGMRQGR